MTKTWVEKRQELANQIAFGVGGWYQIKACQGIHDAISEDSAKLVVAEMVNAGPTISRTNQQAAIKLEDSKKISNRRSPCWNKLQV